MNLIANTEYAKIGDHWRGFRLIFNLLSAFLYTAYAIYVLKFKNSSQFSMWLIIIVVVIFIALTITLIGISKTKQKYSKKNYKLITNILRNLIKFVSLVPPVFVLIQGRSFGTGWETALNIYAIIHITYIVYKMLSNMVRLIIRKFRTKTYIKKEEKRSRRKQINEKIYTVAQNVIKTKLDKENYEVNKKGHYAIEPGKYYDDSEPLQIEITKPPIDDNTKKLD